MSSFIADRIVMDGLTFDDVLLIPAYSQDGGVANALLAQHRAERAVRDGCYGHCYREPNGYCHCT